MTRESGDGLNLSSLERFSGRTLVSALRTTFYGGIAAAFAINRAKATQLVDGAILGVVLADYVTWSVRSVMQLPENLIHGGYDALVNFAFVTFFFRAAHFQMGDDGTSLAAAFMCFMLVLGIKASYYGLQDIQREMGED